MVGHDRTTLARAEAEIGLPPPARNPENNRRVGYTLEQIQAFRKHFGKLPWRDPATDQPIIVACQNFKGGVGKSTTCVNLAHYLALKGYRVLVVDTDSQATTTSMFGYVPDAEIDEDATILPYLSGYQKTLDYAVRTTYWPNIDLIPACLALYEAELAIVMHLATQTDVEKRVQFFLELKYGLQTVADELRRDPARFAAGARHDLDQRADGGGCAAGAVGRADVRFQLDRAVLPHGAQLHRQDRRDEAVPLDFGADDAVRPALREPEAVLRGDDDVLCGLDVQAGVFPFVRGDQLGGAVRRAL